MNTLPNFTSVFFYGRWSQTDELLEEMKMVSQGECESVKWVAWPQNLSEYDEDHQSGYLLTMDEDPAGNYDMTLSDIYHVVESIRKHIKDCGLHSTQIESFKWEGQRAYVELSCL